MKTLLVDTSVLVDFLRRRDKKQSLLVKLAGTRYKLSASIITHAELYAGKSVWERRTARRELEMLFSGLTMFPLDLATSELAGKIRAQRGLNLIDAIIAATAISQKISLVTLNLKDFKKVPRLQIWNQ